MPRAIRSKERYRVKRVKAMVSTTVDVNTKA
jgi:hypothetical protein